MSCHANGSNCPYEASANRSRLVHMLRPALEGYGGGEKNYGSRLDQSGDEGFCPVLRQVLRHFQRASKIKAAAKVAHVSKVDRPETIGRNFQQMTRNIIAVHAKIVGYAVPLEFLEPAANTAAEIHDRKAWEQ